jgi:hypothetical protein
MIYLLLQGKSIIKMMKFVMHITNKLIFLILKLFKYTKKWAINEIDPLAYRCLRCFRDNMAFIMYKCNIGKNSTITS